MTENNEFLKKSLGGQLAEIESRILLAKNDAPLAAFKTRLMGVSKTQPAEVILEAAAVGLRLFGENRVQEAKEKWGDIRKQYADIELHLIGHLQTNKVREALQIFDVIETVDSEKLVDAIAKEVTRVESPTNRFFIQVNTGEEVQKGGALPKDVDALIAYARSAGLNVTGLMCIPPEGDYPAPHFALLRQMAKKHHLPELSMGMSHDYELAARMGASIVRVGSKLFGSRA